MNRTTKTVLLVVGGLALVALIVCGVLGLIGWRAANQAVQELTVTDPEKIAVIAADLADYRLPAGYTQMGMNLFGFYSGIFATDGQTMIMMMLLPTSETMSQEEFRRQLEPVMESRSNSSGIQWQVLGQWPATIRGEEVDFVLSEGTDSNGKSYRLLSGIFTGNQGPVMLMIMGPKQGWDQKAVESFLKSIK